MSKRYRARQRLGKYRIVRRLNLGPLADVYAAQDTVQQMPVALKVPHVATGRLDDVADFVSEARIASKLQHPNVLPVYNAAFIGEQFVIAMPLGVSSLAERLERRMANALAMDFALQALNALAYAHEHKVIHCDIKPENFILFPDKQIRLADFGFAKVSARTIKGSGSGTIDYIAPEQALGKPRLASDVFSLGLVLYRLFAGVLPEYPFDWPPPAHDRLVARTNREFAKVVRKALAVSPKKRFPNAGAMLAAAQRATNPPRRTPARRRRTKRSTRR
ncbi:MAG: serine/threonine-protein kinase [Pseudomonadota bacterium]